MSELNSCIGDIIIETATANADIYPSKIVNEKDNRVEGEGVLQEANAKNRNGRFYDSRDLFPELTSPRTLELLNTGNFKAENGHPLYI